MQAVEVSVHFRYPLFDFGFSLGSFRISVDEDLLGDSPEYEQVVYNNMM